MRVQITKEHIATAKKRDSQHCMIADAIKAGKTNAKWLLVDVQSIRWSNLKTGKRYVYLTPPIAQQAIIAFDQGKPLKPFAFTLQAPVRVVKVRKQWTGDPKVIKKARAKYERVRRGKPRRKPTSIPSRERHYGVRSLVM